MMDNESSVAESAKEERSATAPSRPGVSYPVAQHVKLALVGATNVGKSLLGNCLLGQRRFLVDNALFTTVDSAIGCFQPYDDKLRQLQALHEDLRHCVVSLPLMMSVIDAAGAVSGAFSQSRGAGLQSWQRFFQADVMVMVLRGFESDDLAHYEEAPDVARDVRMLEQEMMLMDLKRIGKAIEDIEAQMALNATAQFLFDQLSSLLKMWSWIAGEERGNKRSKSSMLKACAGLRLSKGSWDSLDRELLQQLRPLTMKEVMYFVNVSELDYHREQRNSCAADHPSGFRHHVARALFDFLCSRDDQPMGIVVGSVAYEERLLQHRTASRAEDCDAFTRVNSQLHVSVLPQLVADTYRQLGLIRFFTITGAGLAYVASDELLGGDASAGANRATEVQIRAWLLRQGQTIAEAVQQYDVPIARNFLRAEVIDYQDYVLFRGDRVRLAMEGKIQQQGVKYVLSDGDIVAFVPHPSLHKQR